jgi:hypothetical protein
MTVWFTYSPYLQPSTPCRGNVNLSIQCSLGEQITSSGTSFVSMNNFKPLPSKKNITMNNLFHYFSTFVPESVNL